MVRDSMSRLRVRNLMSCLGPAAFTAGLLVLCLFAAPACAEDYQVMIEDPNWTDCARNVEDSTTVNPAKSKCDKYEGKLKVKTIARGPGTPDATAAVWVDTPFDHSHPYFCEILLNYDIYGRTDTSGSAHNEFYLTAELWLEQTAKLLRTETIYSVVDSNWSKGASNEEYSMFYCLVPGKDYRVKLKAEAHCSDGSAPLDTARVDFFTTGNGYGIDLNSVTIQHVHDTTLVWDNINGSDNEVREEYHRKQSLFPRADTLKFESYNNKGDIEGWYIKISDFISASDSAEGDRAIDVWAYDMPICKGDTVRIYVTHWLDNEGCTNAMGIREEKWKVGDEATLIQAGAEGMPDHMWSIGNPTEVPGDPGWFRHRFTLINDDPDDPLKIDGLTFRTDLVRYDTLSTIDFSGSFVFPEVTLAPGDSFVAQDVVTLGTFYGGYVYFKHRIFHPDSLDTAICDVWGAHYVCGTAAVTDDGAVGLLPAVLMLEQNQPNPFAAKTGIRYGLPQRQHINLAVYDVTGRRVRMLAKGTGKAGFHTIHWDRTDDRGMTLPSGVYFYRLSTDADTRMRKLVLLR